MGRPRGYDEAEAVERAMLLFWRRGYGGTSIRDLAAELGLRSGSIYAAFGDKQALFLRALDRYRDGQGAGLLAAVAGDGPLLPRLRALLLGVAEANRAGTGPPGCLVVHTTSELVPGDAEATARVRATFDRIEAALAAALTRAAGTGEIPAATDARAAAGFLTTVLQGLQVVSKADPAHHRVAATVDLALTTVAGRSVGDPQA